MKLHVSEIRVKRIRVNKGLDVPLRDYKILFCVVFVAFCNLVWGQNLLTFILNNEQISLTLENWIGP